MFRTDSEDGSKQKRVVRQRGYQERCLRKRKGLVKEEFDRLFYC